MTQGRATTSKVGSTKVEPKSYGVNPAHAAEIGIQTMNLKPVPWQEGRGIEAPMVKATSHAKGSQGKY